MTHAKNQPYWQSGTRAITFFVPSALNKLPKKQFKYKNCNKNLTFIFINIDTCKKSTLLTKWYARNHIFCTNILVWLELLWVRNGNVPKGSRRLRHIFITSYASFERLEVVGCWPIHAHLWILVPQKSIFYYINMISEHIR